MVIAWVFFASIGMIIARFYKDLLPNVRVRGVAFWFVLHAPLMILVPIFSIIALVIILVDLQGQWVIPEDKIAFIHSIFGIITIILSIIQVTLVKNKDIVLFNLFNSDLSQ